MYELGILVLGGLVTAKTVDLCRHALKDVNKAMVLFASAAVGVAYAFLMNYSLFSGWHIGVRADWIGIAMSGLFMAGVAGAWHEMLGMMREWAHRYHGEATEIEARLKRAD